MKKQKAKQLKEADPPLSEDDYLEQTMAIDDAREWEEWQKWLNELRRLNKEQLVQLISEARDREDNLWGVIMRRNGRLANVEQEIRKLQAERERRLANQTKGRRRQADDRVAKSDRAVSLGVDDYFGLLCEAIAQLERNPELKQSKTYVADIRAIIVNLLCESNRSRHSYDRSEWIRIVEKNVRSGDIGTAKQRQKRKA
jgi:hypothetical protein